MTKLSATSTASPILLILPKLITLKEVSLTDMQRICLRRFLSVLDQV